VSNQPPGIKKKRIQVGEVLEQKKVPRKIKAKRRGGRKRTSGGSGGKITLTPAAPPLKPESSPKKANLGDSSPKTGTPAQGFGSYRVKTRKHSFPAIQRGRIHGQNLKGTGDKHRTQVNQNHSKGAFTVSTKGGGEKKIGALLPRKM